MRQRPRNNWRSRGTRRELAQPRETSLLGRNFEMRRDPLGITLAFAIALINLPAALAQTKQAAMSPKASSPDQAYDLSGVWFDDHPRLIRVQERYWAYTFTPEAPPMTPWAQAK